MPIQNFRPGEVIATQSPGCRSRTIRICTLADLFWSVPAVDHVGIIGCCNEDGSDGDLHEALMDSKRVECNLLHRQIRRYHRMGCRLWHFPLARPLSAAEADRLCAWLEKQVGKPYDFKGARKARSLFGGWLIHALPESWHYLSSRETLGNWFCSEHVGAGLREVNRFHTRNVSEWSPVWLCYAGLSRGVFIKPFEIPRST